MTEDGSEKASLIEPEVSLNRKEAAFAIAPFVALGLADVVLLLLWGLDPLWGFAILPPILFVSVLGWIGFRSGFIGDRVDEPNAEGTGGAGRDSTDAEDIA